MKHLLNTSQDAASRIHAELADIIIITPRNVEVVDDNCIHFTTDFAFAPNPADVWTANHYLEFSRAGTMPTQQEFADELENRFRQFLIRPLGLTERTVTRLRRRKR